MSPFASRLRTVLLAAVGSSTLLHIDAVAARSTGVSGPSVVAGRATITSQTPDTTLITQSTTKALINWHAFSISQGSTVRFLQPSSSAIALNRVIGSSPSAIFGNLEANGQVWLVNPNGILFGRGSQINVGALLATTSDIRDRDFLSGAYSFGIASSNPDAAVVNQGEIRAGTGGSVVLSGSRVANDGLIEADLGHVVLAGAETFAVDFTGDNLLRFAVTAPVQDTDSEDALVSNAGKIAAPGGKVLLTARAARDVLDGVINSSGIIEATTASMQDGVIVLDAGPNASAVVSGKLDASGTDPGETGGAITVLGETVELSQGASLDASGDQGGGTVLVGGNMRGEGPEPNATRTTLHNATIAADAIGAGDGGTIVVWSNEQTNISGTLSARGGAETGDGGTIETSGGTLGVAPETRVDTSAPGGTTGMWLLDPYHLYVSIAPIGDPASFSGGVVPLGSDPGATVSIAPTTVITALGSSNVRLEAEYISVLDPVTYTSANRLSLLATRDATIDASVQNAGTGAIDVIAGWDGVTAPANVLATAGAYGQNNGFVQLTGSGGNGVAVGSRAGITTVAGASVHLYGNSADGFAQIGYRGTSATGAINVYATSADPPVTDTSVYNTGLPGCYEAAPGNICVHAALSDDAGAYAQIGHLGRSIEGTASGNVTVNATGNIVLLGGGVTFLPGDPAGLEYLVPGTLSYTYAMIGSGDASLTTSNQIASGTIDVQAAGTIYLNGPTAFGARAWIGNRAAPATGNFSGDVTVIAATFGGATNTGAPTDPAPMISSALGIPGASATCCTGGDVTLGLTSMAPFHAGGSLTLAGPNTFTWLTAGDLFIEGNIQHGGSGSVTLVAGWDPEVAPADVLSTPGAYGLNEAQVVIGGPSAAGDSIVQSKSGTVTIASHDLVLDAVNGFAQLGWNGSDATGGVVVNLTGDLSLNGGTSSTRYALIGNGDAGDTSGIDNLSGNIDITVAGMTTLTSGVGKAWIGNHPGTDSLGTASGDVRLITGNLIGDYMDPIAADLVGGDFTLGITGPGGFTFAGPEINYNSANTLSILSTSDVFFLGSSVQNAGTGAINVIAGWDGITPVGSVISTSGAYGQDNGSVQIFSSLGSAAVGSRAGTTTVAAASVFLAVTTPSAPGEFAQIGYRGDGATGAINVYATSSDPAFSDTSAYDTGLPGCYAAAGGNVCLFGALGGGPGTYAQIGHLGQSLSGTAGGPIAVNATGNVVLLGGGVQILAGDPSSEEYLVPGTLADAYAMIGNGDASLTLAQTVSGTINVSAGGGVYLNGSTTASSPAWIGNYTTAGGNHSGDVTITAAGIGGATSTGAPADFGPMIASDLGIAGQSSTCCTGGDVTLRFTASEGVALEAQSLVANYDSANTLGILSVGDITLSGSLIQNAGTGAIIVAAGWDGVTAPESVLTTPGAYGQNNAVVEISGASGDGAAIGSRAGSTTIAGASVHLYGSGPDGFAQIGYRGNGATGAINVHATSASPPAQGGADGVAGCSDAAGGNVCVIGGEPPGSEAYAQIGHLGQSVSGAASGNITVSATGNVVLGADGMASLPGSPGSSAYSYSMIGSGDLSLTTAGQSVSGDIVVGAGGTIFFNDGITWTGDNQKTARSSIGNRSSGSGGGNYSGDVSIAATAAGGLLDIFWGDVIRRDLGIAGTTPSCCTGGDVTVALTSPNGITIAPSQAVAYNSANSLNILSPGDIHVLGSIENSGAGAINVIAGWDGISTPAAALGTPGAFGLNDAQVVIGGAGAAGNSAIQSRSGTVTIASHDLILDAAKGFAQLGWHGSDASANIEARLTGDLNLEGGANAGNYALIGHGDASGAATGFSNLAGDINLDVAGLTAIDGNAGKAWIGHHPSSNSQGTASGDVALTTGDLSGDFVEMIAADLKGGDFTLALTDPSGPLVFTAAGESMSYDSSHVLSILSAGDVIFNGSVQNAGTGAIMVVAGWDGVTAPANILSASAYGLNNASIELSSLGVGVAVGSKGGTTTMAASLVELSAESGFAQIGYAGSGATGAIGVYATGASSPLQDSSAFGAGVPTCVPGSGNVCLFSGAESGFYAQIGHLGLSGPGTAGGDITVNASGHVVLLGGGVAYGAGAPAGGSVDYAIGGGATNAYAQIGHGNASGTYIDTLSGDIAVRSGGTIYLDHGVLDTSPALIGHGTAAGGTTAGNVSIVGIIGGYTPPDLTPPAVPPLEDPAVGGIITVLSSPAATFVVSPLLVTQPLLVIEAGGVAPLMAMPLALQQSPLLALTGEEGADPGSEAEIAADELAASVGSSLDGSTGQRPTRRVSIIAGLLSQIVPAVGTNVPRGIPPADENFSSWGNKALWQ
jgi:filamentous hemagglutinin family protein